MLPDPHPSSATHGSAGLEVWLEESLPALLAFLRHSTGSELASRESVEDLAQSVCREVLEDRSKLAFDAPEKFRAYLFLQAARKVVDRARFHRMARRDSRREERLPEDSRGAVELGVYSNLVTASGTAQAREHLARVEACLQGLPEAQREAVLLSRIAGLSYAEIAQAKGATESAIRGLVARGLARICVLLELER